tara:strand:+ start:60401 stop:64351 length:3951 start_codon:yes stop_codon:yes gene_type:complete
LKKGKILLLICFCFTGIIQSQDYYFKHYTVENGLSHNTVLSSIQDKNGFMWFGTKNGLNRFDGYSFRLFQNNPDDPKSLKGNYIESLHEFDGILWVGTDNGLSRYNEENENFDYIEDTGLKPVLSIENDNDGNIWYIASGNLSKYNPKTKENFIFPTTQYFSANHIVKTAKNKIWVASTNRLYQYIKETNSFKTYALDLEENIKSPIRINRLFSLDDNTVLIGTLDHGVLAFDLKEKRIKNTLQKLRGPIYVKGFALNGKDELWIASESGIHIYNLKTHKYINLVKNNNNPYALSDNAIYCLTLDHEGGIWAGTYFGGLNYFSPQYSPFKKYFPNSSKNSISGNAVREIHSDKYGNLWIGTEDAGLNKFDPNTGLFTNYTSKDKGGILSHYNVHGILPDGDKLWIGLFDNGLDVLDIKSNKIIAHYNTGEPYNLLDNFIFSIYKTKTRGIVLITPSVIQSYNADTKSFSLFGDFPNYIFYTCFFEDNDGIFWAGSYSEGLFYYNPKTKEKGHFVQDSKDASAISNNHINGIFEDTKKNIWITTENGLNLLDNSKTKFKKYGTKDGFPSNAFYSILEENEDKLWISTSNGLVAFEPQNGNKKIYKKVNGLLSDQFNYNSAYKAPDGTMYFGSVKGMISFNPKQFVENSFQSKVLITGLQVNNQEVVVGYENSPLKKSITFLDKLELKPNESSFSLDFAALSFTGPETTEYWYKMEGISSGWIPLKKDHKVYFTELPTGNYTFTVKSLNYNNVWSNESEPLKIEVLPVFWKSKPAYFLYTLLCILIIYIATRYYHKRTVSINLQRIKELSNKKEKEIYHAKIEFFTNISHEIRTPLTLIKSPLDKLLKQANTPDAQENLSIMEKNTSRLLDLVNQLLDFRKTEIESISLTFVETNVTTLIKNTCDRFKEAIKDKNIDFKLNLGDTDVFAFVDAEAVKKILSNLIGNAIKYSQNKIIATLSVDSDVLELQLQNDGELIPDHLHKKIFDPFFRVSEDENQTGTGIGLALAYSLTKLHQGNLTLNIKDSKWNSFLLTLPIHQEREFKLSHSKDLQEQNIPEIISNDLETPSNKPKILLAEDNIDLLNFVSKDLSDLYKVIKVTNGTEALKIIENENIQLIISDVMMPSMNGYELCKVIKSSLETSHIPVVLLTSKNALNAKIEGLESGADAYIEKPFSMPHLRVQVNNLIENRKNILSYYTSSPLAHLKSIALSDTDETFIDKLDEIISQHISNTELSVETLSDIMNMSRSTLYRKIKEMSNLSPNELINIARLKKAAELLKKGEYKIYEVSEMVGYNSQTSFGRNFQKQFNMTPTEYMNS